MKNGEYENPAHLELGLAFRASCDEAKELREQVGQIVTDGMNPEQIRQRLVAELFANLSQLAQLSGLPVPSEDDLYHLAESVDVAKDLHWLYEQLRMHGTDEQIRVEARKIYNPNINRPDWYIGPELHEVLRRSRLLGMVPFDVLDKMSRLQVVAMGVSAAYETLLSLVNMGVGTGTNGRLLAADPGLISPNTGTKGGGSLSAWYNQGLGKVSAWKRDALAMQPYGKYWAAPVIFNPATDSIAFANTYGKADVVLETVDNPNDKLTIASLIQDYRRNQLSRDVQLPPPPLIIRIADIGFHPSVVFEELDGEQRFGRTLNQQENMLLATFLAADNQVKQRMALPVQAIIATGYLSGDPTVLAVVAQLARMGILPQAGITAKETASIATLGLMQWVASRPVDNTGNEYGLVRSETKNDTFYRLDDRAKSTLGQVFMLMTMGASKLQID